MASFNTKYFQELMEKIDEGANIESTLELLAKLAIPAKVASEQKLLEKLATLVSHATISSLCENVVKNVNKIMEDEQEKVKKEEEEKHKKERQNEKRREAYKRKKAADETIKMEAKKMKMDTEKSGEPHKTDAAIQKPKPGTEGTVAATKSKPAPKKTNLMMKCLRDANKLRKQFK